MVHPAAAIRCFGRVASLRKSTIRELSRLAHYLTFCCYGAQGNGTPMTMREQLEMVDMHGMTLLMHATRSGDVAIFQAVANEICSSQVMV